MPFDAAVYVVMLVAVCAGFRAGFLRSVATILAYLAALPLALAALPFVAPAAVAARAGAPGAAAATPWAEGTLVFFAVFLAIGIGLGALARAAVAETVGERIGIADRLAGAALGAVRVLLIAVLLVLVFDRLIPPGREPAFLAGSRLRPYLSLAGQVGLRTLPPETAALIDRLRVERRL
jgi:membrane protein required for colicin V production